MAATRIIIRPNYLFWPRINFVLSSIRARRKVHRPAILRLIITETTIYRATKSDFISSLRSTQHPRGFFRCITRRIMPAALCGLKSCPHTAEDKKKGIKGQRLKGE